jgi:hypothetical protein
MARPSSRLLSRTTTSRTTPVFAAETGSDTENVDARDIVEGRVAEVGYTCQIPAVRRAAEARRRREPAVFLYVSATLRLSGSWDGYRALALVGPDCASSMK